MSGNRPDLHTPEHDQWDQGGYCNNLVLDDDGCGTVCGYRAPSNYTPTADEIVMGKIHLGDNYWRELTEDEVRRGIAQVKAGAIREYVEAARENPHTQYWPASGVLDDAEQWADEIEKGTIR